MIKNLNGKPKTKQYMKNFFANCLTLDEAKKLYFELAKKLHPDKGGNTADFQELANQFEAFQPKTEKFQGEKTSWNAKEYASIINALVNIPEIVIEIIGSFVWVSGNTKTYKDQIKAVEVGESYNKAMFHSKKVCWYFSPKNYRRFSGKEFSLDEIREFYGSTRVEKTEKRQVQGA